MGPVDLFNRWLNENVLYNLIQRKEIERLCTFISDNLSLSRKAVHIAMELDSVEIIQTILQSVSPEEEKGNYCSFFLYYAAKLGATCVADLVIREGADVNFSHPKEGQTPLQMALFHTHLPLITLLLEAGAKPNVVGNEGCTPLHDAIENDILIHGGCVANLLFYGADINAQDVFGHTPLHCAVRFQKVAIAALLLEKGAKCDLQDLEGKTPLHFAVESGDYSLVQLLLDNGARVDIRDVVGHTPLCYAHLNRDFKIGELFLRHLGGPRPDLPLEKHDLFPP